MVNIENMKYYLIAGERSGDLHGSNLIKALKQEDTAALFRAMGGDYMQQAGAVLYRNYRDIAVMGFVDVLKNILKFRALFRDCTADIRKFNPDVVILIDFAGFNLRLAKILKKYNIKIFYYISPKIWAWDQKRAYKVRKYIDQMFTILPFEQDFYRKFGVESHYVGNPVLDAVKSFTPGPFHKKYDLSSSKPLIALLPGSRNHEVRTTLPMMMALTDQFPEHQFGISVVNNIPEAMYEAASNKPGVRLIYEDNYNLLANACCAVVASGTATLETALLNVPQVVVYRLSRINWYLGMLFVKVKYISLVNLIMDRPVVKELLQKSFTIENLVREVGLLVNDKDYIAKMKEDYSQLTQKMGDHNASANAAAKMMYYLKGNA